MSVNGIPTSYGGVRFRSRLEAKWAAFFDTIGWRWTYEPFDLEGYIPDFVLHFRKPMLVEVKPDLSLEDLKAHASKIEKTSWKHEFLIVGSTMFYGSPFPALGLLAERYGNEASVAPAWSFRCGKCGEITFCHEEGSYECRVNSCYDGDSFLKSDDTFFDELKYKFGRAGNEVQWFPKERVQ